MSIKQGHKNTHDVKYVAGWEHFKHPEAQEGLNPAMVECGVSWCLCCIEGGKLEMGKIPMFWTCKHSHHQTVEVGCMVAQLSA